jgi:hypothetical protein
MGYRGIEPNNIISIDRIYSIHYFEYMSDFSFEGEAHDFWEFIYVDKGEVGVTAEKTSVVLKKGEILFHQPNEFHNVQAVGGIAPNLIVASFSSKSPSMDFFKRKTLNIDENIHYLLADIIIEARKLFDCRLDDPYLQNMPLKPDAPAGSEQLIRLYLENMLIHLTRKYQNPLVLGKSALKAEPFKAAKNKGDIEIFNRVNAYLENHINEHISIEQICRDNLVGRSQLQKIFKEQCDLGIIEYFSTLKINASKELIRTRHMNFTQIAEQLGYTSIHYFSRQFKRITGMTPSEYASSVKAVADGSFEEK